MKSGSRDPMEIKNGSGAKRGAAVGQVRAPIVVLECREGVADHGISSRRFETADAYHQVVLVLRDNWRVIVCRDGRQWILQRRKKGGAERPWRAVGYFRTRDALLRACATDCGPNAPNTLDALVALPEHFR